MPVANTIQGDTSINGNISANSMTPIANSVTNASVQVGAAVDGAKLGSILRKMYSQPNVAATSERRVIYRAHAAGTVLNFRAGSIAIAVGAATVTLDLKKNGVSILTVVITLDTANVAFVSEEATLTGGAPYAVGDVFDVTVTATAAGGTLPTGVYAEFVSNEAPA